jgi:hypothetical protein
VWSCILCLSFVYFFGCCKGRKREGGERPVRPFQIAGSIPFSAQKGVDQPNGSFIITNGASRRNGGKRGRGAAEPCRSFDRGPERMDGRKKKETRKKASNFAIDWAFVGFVSCWCACALLHLRAHKLTKNVHVITSTATTPGISIGWSHTTFRQTLIGSNRHAHAHTYREERPGRRIRIRSDGRQGEGQPPPQPPWGKHFDP